MEFEKFIPPEDMWPHFIYPDDLKLSQKNYNLAWYLMDRHIEAGFSERPLVFFKKMSFSYDYIFKASLRIANFLKKKGYKKGDRIGFVLLNSPQSIAINIAIFRIGGISVPISPYWKPHIMEYLLKAVRLKAIFVSAKFIEKVFPVIKNIETIKDIVVIKRELPVPEGTYTQLYENILEKEEDHYILEKVEPDFPCVILHTSGTTGMPKGCIHFAKNIIYECFLVNKYVWRLGIGDIIAGAAPVTFAAGFGTFILIPLFAGATELLFTQFIPEKIIEGIEEFKANVLTGLTSFYEALLNAKNFSQEKFKTVRMCTTGGSPLEPRIFKRWMDETGMPIYEGLGATEFLHLIVSNAVRLKPKIGSFGIPIPGIRVRIVDEKGRDCKTGELGRMLVKGPTGPLYWNNIEKQKNSVIDGWSYIGDIIFKDEEGYLHFASREEDLLQINGQNYSPLDVEEVVKEHPLIKDAGVIEDKVKEKIILCVSLENPEKSLKQLETELKSLILKKLKNPKLIPHEITVVDYIPRTPAGKILRWKLRKWMHIEE